MEIAKKKQAFEYFLSQMIKWGEEMNPTIPLSSFTRLKALKLLFFMAVIKNAKGDDLLDVFDNFYALPNGPVESDIYNCITSDALTYYTFLNFSFDKKIPYDDDEMDIELKQRIDLAVKALRSINSTIICYSAEQLVKLSHYWLSWQSAFHIANALGKGSYRMDVKAIRNNKTYFAL